MHHTTSPPINAPGLPTVVQQPVHEVVRVGVEGEGVAVGAELREDGLSVVRAAVLDAQLAEEEGRGGGGGETMECAYELSAKTFWAQ